MTKSPSKDYAANAVIQPLHQIKTGNGAHVVIYKEVNEDEDDQYGSNQNHGLVEPNISTRHANLKAAASIIFKILPLLLIAISLGWILIPCFIRYQISNKVVISPEANPELYSAWVHPPVPVYLKVYLFNVTNPEEVRKGSLPNLQEVGPYVFQENRTKKEIAHDDPSDTVTYKEHVSFHFRQDLSGDARLEENVTILNVPFAAAAIKIWHDLPWPLNDMGKLALSSYKEPLFVQRTVEETLFKGWKVPFLEGIENDTGISVVPNNTFGFLIEQNDTSHGPFTVSRGTHDKSSFGAILRYKNETELDFWADHPATFCNKIYGTDGTIFPPFVTKSTTLRLFNPELCRSLYMTYSANSEFEGIKGYRFVAPPTIIQDPRAEGENRCFCLTVDDEPEQCLKQGALDLGPCRDGAPVAMSLPHFLDAYSEYVQESGLSPVRKQHETFLDIEPMTGLILQASKKIQINLILKRVKGLSSLSKVPEMLFPLVWADECAALDPENTAKFKAVLFQLWLIDFVGKWGLLSLALLFSLLIISKHLRCQRQGIAPPSPGKKFFEMNCNGSGATEACLTQDREESDDQSITLNGSGSHWSSKKVALAIPEETEQEA